MVFERVTSAKCNRRFDRCTKAMLQVFSLYLEALFLQARVLDCLHYENLETKRSVR